MANKLPGPGGQGRPKKVGRSGLSFADKPGAFYVVAYDGSGRLYYGGRSWTRTRSKAKVYPDHATAVTDINAYRLSDVYANTRIEEAGNDGGDETDS